MGPSGTLTPSSSNQPFPMEGDSPDPPMLRFDQTAGHGNW